MIMVNLENHKGCFCAYTPQFCQEGYCSRCEIYLKITSSDRQVNRRLETTLQEVANNLNQRVLS